MPNSLAFHNRILGIFGFHPRSAKIISAHVRHFSKHDTINFYDEIKGKKIKIENFYGSQFYPFNKFISRGLSILFPSLATSIFFIIKKTGNYNNEFIKWLDHAELETNFFRGKK